MAALTTENLILRLGSNGHGNGNGNRTA